MNKINKNNNKLRNIFMLGILPSLTLITVMSAVISSNSNIINNKDNNMVVKGDPISYNLSFNPYGLLDSASSSTEKSFITSRVITYPLTFNYKKAYSDDINKVTKINEDGYIKNSTEIKGINSIRYTGTGSLRLELGYSTSYMEVTNLIINSNEEYVLSNSYNYFSISNSESTPVEVSSLSIKYSCVAGSHSESFTEGLKFNYLSESDSFNASMESGKITSNPSTINIPDTYLGKRVTSISGNFSSTKLTTVNLPRYLNKITAQTFENTRKITKFNLSEDNEYFTILSNTVIVSKDETTLHYIGVQTLNSGYTLPNSITTIKAFAIDNADSSSGYLIIPNRVTTIESYGLYNSNTKYFTDHEAKPEGWANNYYTRSNVYFASEWHLDDGGAPVVNS